MNPARATLDPGAGAPVRRRAAPEPAVLDEAARACYERRCEGVTQTAARLGLSVRAIHERALALGLIEPDMSGREREVFRRYSHEAAASLQTRLQKAGIVRSLSFIRRIRKAWLGRVEDIRTEKQVFTSVELAELLGVSDHMIRYWHGQGLLHAESGRHAAKGARLLIPRRAVQRFLSEHGTLLEGKPCSVAFLTEFISNPYRAKSPAVPGPAG